MKPTPGILYQIGGKIVCNEMEKPELADFERYSIVQTITDVEGYEKAEKSWLSGCKDVVNVEYNPDFKFWQVVTLFRGHLYNYNEVINGQKVLKVPEGEGVRIVELK